MTSPDLAVIARAHAAPILELPLFVTLILLVAAFAAHGRAIGAGVNLARSVGSLLLLAVAGLLAGPAASLLALGWAISRTMDFKPGVATPTTGRDFQRAAARQIPVLATAAVATVTFGLVLLLPAAAVYLAVFLALAAWYGDANAEAIERAQPIDPGLNTIVELGQGAAMGACAWAGVVLGSA
jgi:hypothetical protein